MIGNHVYYSLNSLNSLELWKEHKFLKMKYLLWSDDDITWNWNLKYWIKGK